MGGARRPAAVVNGAREPPADPLPFLEFLVGYREQPCVNPLFFLFQRELVQREQVVASTIPDPLREHRKMEPSQRHFFTYDRDAHTNSHFGAVFH